jgi:hypothetical protein
LQHDLAVQAGHVMEGSKDAEVENEQRGGKEVSHERLREGEDEQGRTQTHTNKQTYRQEEVFKEGRLCVKG